MKELLVMLLLSLVTLTIVDFITDHVKGFEPLKGILTLIVGIGGVYGLDYSFFERSGISIRDRGLGLIVTGVMVVGLIGVYTALMSFLASGMRGTTKSAKVTDVSSIKKAA
jgi:hypothetical protein